MANQVMFIANPTATAYTDVNGAGDDVPAYSRIGPITLTDAEQATFAAAHKTALIQLATDTTITGAEQETNRLATKIMKLGFLPGTATQEH